jgi:hypothetical protein
LLIFLLLLFKLFHRYINEPSSIKHTSARPETWPEALARAVFFNRKGDLRDRSILVDTLGMMRVTKAVSWPANSCSRTVGSS